MPGAIHGKPHHPNMRRIYYSVDSGWFTTSAMIVTIVIVIVLFLCIFASRAS